MPRGEIQHRIYEQVKRTISRFHLPKFLNFSSADYRLPIVPGLHTGLASLRTDKELIDNWQEIANRARKRNFLFLGLEWPAVNNESYWHLDPITKQYWPDDVYCFRIAYRHSQSSGDVKYVWELNRLQFLQPIAALASLEGKPELARFCVETLESWIDANPPFKGVNWASGIELACRIVSILVVTSLLKESIFTETQRQKLINYVLWQPVR